jgi:hypothetical protein
MRTVVVTLIFVFVLLASACGASAPPDAALLRGDWSQVAAGIAPADPTASKVVTAHAYIAVNRNNEALCLLAALSDDERRQWDEWTQTFVGRHPRSSVAHYLRGDAFARRGRWAEAIAAFDTSIDIDRNSLLAFNARGVVRSIRHEWDEALGDLVRASDIDAHFVDAVANRGSMQLLRQTGAEGAIDDFNVALRSSPDFVAAAIGKAYAQLALARWADGSRELGTATARMVCAPAVLGNRLARLTAWVDERSGPPIADDSVPPGTELDRQLRSLASGNVSALKPIARIVGSNPELERKTAFTLEGIKQQNPTLHKEITSRISSGQNWTKPNGGAQTLLSNLGGLEVGGGVTLGKAPVTVNGNVKYNAGSAVTLQKEKTSNDYQGWTKMQKMTGAPSAAGGVTTNLVDAAVDRGDWPFEPIYTLLYTETRGTP